MQVSYGDLKSPEQLAPDTRVQRTTASISYQRRLDAAEWGTTLAYGRNCKSGPETDTSEPGWPLESTYVLRDADTFFGRAEQVKNSELFDTATRCTGRHSASASSPSAISTTSRERDP